MKKSLIIPILALVMLGLNASYLSAEMRAEDYAKLGLKYQARFPGLASLCDLNTPFKIAGQRVKASGQQDKTNKKRKRSEPIPATKVFDNLYFVGTGGVSSWVLKTEEGLILIDALNNTQQAKKYIEKGLISLGLDPNDLKYLIITHGHGDHYGGQAFLVKKYQTRLVMSDIEWSRLEQPKLDFSSSRWGTRPKRDISIEDGDTIQLGQTQVNIYVTPGHTPGTISLIFPVYDQGKKHMVALWGGTGLNYGPDQARILNYSKAAKRFGELANLANVDVFMSNHPKRDGSSEKLLAMNADTELKKHPFVMGQTSAQSAFQMLSHCTYAQALRIQEGNF